MDQLIAKRYATALFEIAMENGQLDAYEKEVKTLLEIIKNENELLQTLGHPHILAEEKIDLLEKIFASTLSKDILGLMVMVVRKSREAHLVAILEAFVAMAKEAKHIATATVTSAVPLTEEQKAKIVQKLTTSLGKAVELDTAVDPSLMGGLIIRVGDRVIDSSIAGKLNGLTSQLYNLQLA